MDLEADVAFAKALAAGDEAALERAEIELVPAMRQAAGKIDAQGMGQRPVGRAR